MSFSTPDNDIWLWTKNDINDEKYNELRKELGMSYSFLKNIDLTKITISNMFEFLDDLNKKYGNSYILKQL